MIMPQSFVPDADFGSSNLQLELPPGVRPEDTAAVSASAYRIVARQPEVSGVVESIGGDDPAKCAWPICSSHSCLPTSAA